MATKKKESTMKTVGVKNTSVITDGCNPELVTKEKVYLSSQG